MINRRHLLTVFLVVVPLASRAGAWGEGSFDNDDAMDWVSNCIRSKDAAVVLAALRGATSRGFLEAATASSSIAAAEVVAAAKGRPAIQLPTELQAWIKTQRREELAAFSPVALQALERILSPKGSELRELWKNSKRFPAWEATVKGLAERVR